MKSLTNSGSLRTLHVGFQGIENTVGKFEKLPCGWPTSHSGVCSVQTKGP